MKKYFVKYVIVYPSGREENQTRFFNTDDIEHEWACFENLSDFRLKLVDITPLGQNMMEC